MYARKHVAQEVYLIYGTVQPQSNQIGNAPPSLNASFFLGGSAVTLEVRRQGSTYVFDNTTAGTPSLTQVDAWHEATHPSHWSKSFVFEAEAHLGLSTEWQRSAETMTEVSFQWKNPDFRLRNPDFLIRNSDFLLKNVDFILKIAQGWCATW